MLVNTRVELLSLKSQYVDKIAKAESEKQAALSAMYEAESIVTKNAESVHEFFYKKRILLYYFSSGWIHNKSLRAGIGETVKEGEDLMSIMPANYNLAIEVLLTL